MLLKETTEFLCVVVADGLGSKPNSKHGAATICELVAKNLVADVSVEFAVEKAISNWYDIVTREKTKTDYSTTCSFAIIDKLNSFITIGQIGDSPVWVRTDKNTIITMMPDKDFSNETECIGGYPMPMFRLRSMSFDNNLEILISTDGFGEEIMDGAICGLLDYLKEQYSVINTKERNLLFTQEIHNSIGLKNNDDKSVFYIWS